MRKSNLIKILNLPWKTTRWTFRKLRLFIKHRLGWLDEAVVVPYRGFYSRNHLFLAGAVMENKGLRKPERKSSVWQNIVAMLKRYSSDQIPGIDLEISLQGRKYESVSDENGYFRVISDNGAEHSGNGTSWLPYTVRAVIEDENSLSEISASSELVGASPGNTFGLISDIDDTILVSHSTQTLKKLRLMLLRNAITRKPFPGASAFYTALQNGYSGKENNPVFYISSSEWNLYDLLDDFCSHNNFPRGVFMLRELEGGLFKSGQGNHNHKLLKIRAVMTAFDHLPFVLVGDNGQHDPYIYKQISEEFPGRVKVVYIRYISRRKSKKIKDLIKEMKDLGTDMLLVRDTYEAALDAANRKLIAPDAGKKIHLEKDADINRPNPVEEIL
ncbi:MAG TPA: phosphatase domain-containing protein [Bacteroidales bacterium]|nr:phosphatase domain-containing protein [Bacteroidales bacterium]